MMENKKKIALIGYRLNKGGAERVMAILSTFFENQGIEVYIFIVLDDVAYNYSGKLINLGKLKNKTNGVFNKINRLIALKKTINNHEFDFIIDFRFRTKFIQEFILSKWIFKTKTIYTVHSSELHLYMPKQIALTKLIYGKSFKVVAITDNMQNLIQSKYQLKNLVRIYNPVDVNHVSMMANEEIDLNYEFAISAGHFNTNQKQFDKLIIAYSKSILPNKGIALVILGEGLKKEELSKLAFTKGVGSLVHFLGFKENPFKYFSKAKFFIMTSLHEGMPMVLIESLACGTPVIAFDCPTGPQEIIQHGMNGLLIENQNMEKLIQGMDTMINDEILYSICKMNTQKSIEKFSINVIGKEWLELMNFN